MYKTLNEIYDRDYEYLGKLDKQTFNEHIIPLVKSGLKKDEIRELLQKSVEGEENEFSPFIVKDNLNNTNTVFDIVLLILFGIVFTIMLFNLFI